MFTGTNVIDFAKIFPDNESCYRLLDSIKWKDGYKCIKCGCRQYIKGRTQFHRRCRECAYDESLTANTLFHDMRMSIKKAFFILFYIATRVKGMSTAELGRLVGVQQKTGWLMKRKIQVAMQRDGDQLSFFELMLNTISQLIEESNQEQRSARRSTQKNRRRSCLRQGMRNAKNDIKKSKMPDRKTAITFINYLEGRQKGWSYPGTGNQQVLFNSWLAGIHHQCSAALHGRYCDEFAYRFVRRNNKENIFEELIADMLRAKPHPYPVLRLVRA